MNARLHSVPDEAPRVVGYVRVSTAREEMISPELQRSAIEDYCARRGYVLEDVIEDLDETGRNFARKGVQRAIELVESSGVAVVVVWKFSRFGRDRKGWAINLDRVESAGGRLESATEDVDASSSTGRFTRGMLAEVAAWESERIGDQWKEAHERRVRMGLPHDGRERFGYRYHRRTREDRPCKQGCAAGGCEPGYAVDPETAPYVAEMFARYNGGASVLKIAVWLNSRAVRTTNGKPWKDVAVRRFMDTGFAAGLIRVHDKDCRCKVPVTCEKNIFYPGAHKAIIDAETWERYRSNRARRRKLAPRVESPAYSLTGLVQCGKCTGPLNVHGAQHHGVYLPGYMYQCGRYHKSRECEGTWISRNRLEAEVLGWLDRVAAAEINERAAMTTARSAAKISAQVDRKRLLREAQKLAEALTQLTVDKAKGLVPEAAYMAARDELAAEQGALQDALDELANDDQAAEVPVEAARDLLVRWPTMPPSTRRDLLAKLIKHVSVISHGKGVVTGSLMTTWGEEVPIFEH